MKFRNKSYGVIGTALSGWELVSGFKELKSNINYNRFKVSYLDSNGSESSRVVRAKSPVEAISKVSKIVSGSKFRAERLN